MVSEITLDDLKKLIDEKSDFVLIDVREKDELEFGMIPGANNIPSGEISYALLALDDEKFKERYGFDKFDKEDNVVFYCRTGSRSSQVANFAEEKGYNVKNFKGSVWEWSKIDENVRFYGPEPLNFG